MSSTQPLLCRVPTSPRCPWCPEGQHRIAGQEVWPYNITAGRGTNEHTHIAVWLQIQGRAQLALKWKPPAGLPMLSEHGTRGLSGLNGASITTLTPLFNKMALRLSYGSLMLSGQQNNKHEPQKRNSTVHCPVGSYKGTGAFSAAASTAGSLKPIPRMTGLHRSHSWGCS